MAKFEGYKDIYVFVEQKNGTVAEVGYELISEARKLVASLPEMGYQVVGVLLGSNITDKAQDVIAHGADKVIVVDDELLKEKVVRVAEQKNVLLEHLYHKPLINPDDLYKELQEYKEMIAPYVCDTSLFLHNAIKEGKNILLEGQLGSLKLLRSKSIQKRQKMEKLYCW